MKIKTAFAVSLSLIVFLITGLTFAVNLPKVTDAKLMKPLNQAIRKGPPVSATARAHIKTKIPNKFENYIFITWCGVDNAVGYNIYREGTGVDDLINPDLIKPIKTDIQNIIRVDSDEWPVIARALDITDPNQFWSANKTVLLPASSPPPGQLPTFKEKIVLNRDNIRWSLSQIYASVARVMGAGYLDTVKLHENKKYHYEVRVVTGMSYKKAKPQYVEEIIGQVEIVCKDMRTQMEAPEPKECAFYEGDQYVEILWPAVQRSSNNEVKNPTIGFDIYKLDANGTSFKKLNSSVIMGVYRAPSLLHGKLNSPVFDQRDPKVELKYKSPSNPKDGKLMAYYVDQTIMTPAQAGPTPIPSLPSYLVPNGTPRKYKIVPRDLLGPGFNPKQLVTVKPVDLFPPACPGIPKKITELTGQWKLPAPKGFVKCLCKSGSCRTCSLCNPQFLSNNLINSGNQSNNTNSEVVSIINYPTKDAGTMIDYYNGIRFEWEGVNLNAFGCPEEIGGYKVFRYATMQDATTDQPSKRTEIGPVLPPPNNIFAIEDRDKKLKSETIYWYRIHVVDKAGHESASAPFPASFRDNQPPLGPENVRSVLSNTDSITIAWDDSRDAADLTKPAKNTDLAGYRIYRRICGARPVKVKVGEYKGLEKPVLMYRVDDLFRLVGEVRISANSPSTKLPPGAKNLGNFRTYDKLQFQDKTLPGMSDPVVSGLCYEYCIRAFDKRDNQSIDVIAKDAKGHEFQSNVTCDRLQKVKGPKPPTITTLLARSNSIRLEWVAPPVPDLYTFRIYRSDNINDEKAWKPVTNDPPFAGKVYCEETPPDGFPHVKGLNSTPPMHKATDQNGNPVDNLYWFEDKHEILPNTKYWYKIVSVDYWENPFNQKNTPQQQAAAKQHVLDSTSVVMSTYTYDQFINGSPSMNTPSYNSKQGVLLSWNLPSPSSTLTSLLYRSSKSENTVDFAPLAKLTGVTTFTDATARPGVKYWYRVQYVTESNRYSRFSSAVSIQVPEEGTLDPSKLKVGGINTGNMSISK